MCDGSFNAPGPSSLPAPLGTQRGEIQGGENGAGRTRRYAVGAGKEPCQVMHWEVASVTQEKSFMRGMTLVLARLRAGHGSFAMGNRE